MRKLLQMSALGLGLAGCIKSNELFVRDLADAGIIDINPPEFVIFLPNSSGPFNLNAFDFDVNDPVGSNGAAASGPDFTTIEVRNGQALVPITQTGNRYRTDLTGVPDGGPYLFGFSGRDKRGNLGQVTRSMFLDRQGPQISITSGSLPASSADASVPFTYSGSIQDPNLSTATIVIKRPGTNGICGDADDVPWQVGTAPGQISVGSFPLTPAASNPFAINFTAYNGVPAGGQPVNAVYCAEVTASDNALGLNGPSPNTASTSIRKELTWQPQVPPPFALTATVTYRHIGPGVSEVCVLVTTDPPQSGIVLGTVTGPGVVGGTTISGALDPTGSVMLRKQIQSFGSYTGSVSYGGKNASGSVLVSAAQGTCPPPPA